MKKSTKSNRAWAIRINPDSVTPQFIDPTFRKSKNPLYAARVGFPHEYSSIEHADLFSDRETARYYNNGMGGKVVKVCVTIEEV